VRRDPRSNLALLIVDGKGLSQAAWGDSDVLEAGRLGCSPVGHPFGLSDTVDCGPSSAAKGRGIGTSSYEDLIQDRCGHSTSGTRAAR